ncbi:FG-GAP-like repeat-containing protein [Soonwooa sp.]|uniref:FG-GAP-like repeat-containing protein n=1 Tax=Soonwooa sp. TaxID=1938592 RepID=UPI002635204E|nr:FG-GAP-like repeat-containing protein [Soonwooa sp.]
MYINDGEKLVEAQNFEPLTQSSFAIADFDGDGYQDIVAIGSNEDYDNVFRYFKNNGDGSFTQRDTDIEGVANASGSKAIDVGDINKDGYPDIILSGDNDENEAVTKIYTYNPTSKNFELFEEENITQLGGVTNVQLADFNNDNNLDVFISGFDWDATNYPSVTKLYTNDNNLINTKPTPPTILSHTIAGKKLNLEWSGATDDKTPVDGLKYKISLGTTNDKADIAKYIVTTKKWFLELEELPQDIYWSIKSIDAGNQFSNQSEVKKISNLATHESNVEALNIYPNPVKSTLNIDSNKKIKSISVYDISGKLLKTYSASAQLDLSSLSRGSFLLTIHFSDSSVANKKIIKE